MSLKILSGVLVILIIVAILAIINSGKPKQEPSRQPIQTFSPGPTARASVKPGQQTSSPTLTTNIGQTTNQEVDEMSSIESKTVLAEGKIEYKLKSTSQLVGHVIVTQDNVVVFEKAKQIETNLNLAKTSLYFATYGQPEAEATGSKLYGNFEKTYIYASKGFAILVNPFTNEVDELQVFLPTTVDQYQKEWGQDISEQQSGEEKFQ